MRVQQLSHTLSGPPQVASVRGVTVRHFEGGTDIAHWTDLMQSAFFAADPPMRRWTEVDFKTRVMGQSNWSPAHLFLAFDVASQLVGTISLAFRCCGEKSIPAVHLLAVRPAWRRRGIARLLVGHLESACWKMGFRTVHLETHTAWQEAMLFYKAAGYKEAHQVTARPSTRTPPVASRRTASG